MSFSPVSIPTPVSIPNGGTGSATGDLTAVNALTAPLLTASTRVESPTIGTSSSAQHILPVGTAALLAADSSLPAANLTGDIALARIAVSLAAGGGAVKGTVVTATTRVETPTVGPDSGNQHALPGGTEEILAPARGTAGQILTSAGAGSAPAMAAPITATSGEATLSGTFAISGSTGVYQDTGLSISLPSAGTYLILGTVRSAINTTANYGRVVAKLVNSTDAIDVPGGGCVGARTQAVSVTNEVQSPIVAIYTVLAAKTINLYGARIDDVPAPTYLVSQISTAASGPTKLSYIKLN